MTSDDVPKIIANALRFLATGFEMASASGVAGSLRRIDGGANASPLADTFVYAAAVDRSAEIYEATFEVAFQELFKFLFPVTKVQGEALTARILEKFGIRLEMPGFHVTR